MLVLFACAWAWMIVLAIHAKNDGANFDRVIYPVDVQGKICGIDTDTADKPYGAWPNVLYPKYIECIESCDKTQTDYNYTTIKFVHWCLPDPSDAAISNQLDEFNASWGATSRYLAQSIGDFHVLRWVLFATAGGSIFVSLLVVLLSRRCVDFLVWGSIFLVLGGGFVLGGAFFYWYLDSSNAVQDTSLDSWLTLAIITWSITFILLLLVFYLRKEIQIAKEVVKEASRVTGDMLCLMFYPIIPALFILGFVVVFVLFMLYLYSAGDLVDLDDSFLPDPGSISGAKTFSWHETYQYWSIYALFHFFWTTQTVYYLGYLTIAGAVANWYFAATDENGNKRRGSGEDELPSFPIARSCCRAVFYHIGTAAFGALIIAIIRTLRALLSYVRYKTKDSDNKCAKAVLCICSCCLTCLERCLDKVSKNALIWTAIFGDNFCTASCSSFSLIMNHLIKVAAVNSVSSFIVFLCKVCVALACTAGCGVFITYYDDLRDRVNSIMLPLIVTFLVTYFLGAMMMGVFESSIDAIFFCFLVDVDFNQTNGHPMRASKGLADLVQKHEDESRHKAAVHGQLRSTAKVAPANTDGEVEMAARH